MIEIAKKQNQKGHSSHRRMTFSNGRGGPTTHTPIYTIDCIDISESCTDGFSDKITEMRAKGHSTRAISNTLGIGKTTVMDTLARRGISTSFKTLRQQGLRVGSSPYGYVLVQGQHVPDPKEQQVVQIIMTQWKLGRSFNAIAKHLNTKGIAPRNAKTWDHSTISSIVKRHQQEK